MDQVSRELAVTNADRLLNKGIEEEVYTGTRDGTAVGLSHEIAADLQGFVTEPDCRNAEYAMPPARRYEELGHVLLCYRRTLRQYLLSRGDYTLLPGASLARGDTGVFLRSNPKNPYYAYIEENYGTDVVTASTHINIGIEDPEELMRACRVIRAEAALFLALSASSPFIDGRVTGFHSYRWHLFPMTPPSVPFFRDHAHYVAWVEEQLASGAMQNIRHLWLSARPNGIGAPREIQRLELRICDRVDDVHGLLGVIAFIEARVHEILADPGLDPFANGLRDDGTLTAWSAANEAACARDSLECRVTRWDTGRETGLREWLAERLCSARETARETGFDEFLDPVERILCNGNTAQQWLGRIAEGKDVAEVYREAIAETEAQEGTVMF